MSRRACEAPKVKYRRGLWSPDEDQRLRDYVLSHGLTCWTKVPAKAGLQRNGKSCRLRWINYLRPGLKRGFFSEEEEQTVMELQSKLGNKWSQIAIHLPGRTDNEVKNHWNSYLKNKVIKAQKSDNIPPVSTSSDCTNHLNPSLQSEDPDKHITSDIHRFPYEVLFGDCLSMDQASADCSVDLELEQVMRDSLLSSCSELHAPGGDCIFEDIKAQTGKGCIDQIPESALFDLLFPGVVYLKNRLWEGGFVGFVTKSIMLPVAPAYSIFVTNLSKFSIRFLLELNRGFSS